MRFYKNFAGDIVILKCYIKIKSSTMAEWYILYDILSLNIVK